jgi:hypothetical protein
VSAVKPAGSPPPPVAAPPVFSPPPPAPPPPRPIQATPVFVPPGTKRIELAGRNLLGAGGPPLLRLGGAPLSVAEADDDRIVVELPDGAPPAGTLEVEHADGEVEAYELSTTDPWVTNGA